MPLLVPSKARAFGLMCCICLLLALAYLLPLLGATTACTNKETAMRFRILLSLVLFIVVAFVALLPTPEPVPAPDANSFVLGPVHIFNGEEVMPARYDEVRNGIITQLHETAPVTNFPFVEGNNKWLMPGLIDAHVHAWGDALEQQLQRGVTTVIDMFGQPAFLAQRQSQRDSPHFTNEADIFGAGMLITAPHGHGTQFGIQVPTLTDPEQASELVQQRLQQGSDFIKIVYTTASASYPHAPSISYQELTAAIAATHAENKLAVVHIADHASAEEAVAAGADGLVHGFFDQKISSELLQAMRANQVFVIPTMAVYEGMLQGTINDELLFSNSKLAISTAAKITLSQRFDTNMPPAFWQHLLHNTQAMYAAGIPILAGSDAPNPNTAHGWSLIVELLLMEQAGLPASAVLASATAVTAYAFHLTKRGRIQPGYKADMLLLEHSPIDDLAVLLTPQQIWKNGFAMKAAVTDTGH